MIRMDVYRHRVEQPSTPDEVASSLDLAPRGAAALLRSLERGGRANHRLLVLHMRPLPERSNPACPAGPFTRTTFWSSRKFRLCRCNGIKVFVVQNVS